MQYTNISNNIIEIVWNLYQYISSKSIIIYGNMFDFSVDLATARVYRKIAPSPRKLPNKAGNAYFSLIVGFRIYSYPPFATLFWFYSHIKRERFVTIKRNFITLKTCTWTLSTVQILYTLLKSFHNTTLFFGFFLPSIILKS